MLKFLWGQDNVFSKEKINTGRQEEFDIARGLCVLFMLFNHTVEYYPIEKIQNLVFFKNFSNGIGTVAIIFMFVLGLGIVFSRNQNNLHMFRRGLFFLIFGYVFNFLRYCLPLLILSLFNKNVQLFESGFVWSYADLFFQVDIFQFAGLAFMFIAIIRALRIPLILYPIICLISLVMHISFACTKTGIYIFDGFIANLFFGNNLITYFPFFSWLPFPLAGILFGYALQHVKNKDNFYLPIFQVSFILLLIGMSIQLFLYPTMDLFGWHDKFAYYQMGLTGVIFFLFYDLLLFALSYFTIKLNLISNKWLMNEIRFWSKNITSLYVVSWILITWGAIFINGGWCKVQTIYMTFLALILIPILTRIIITYYNKLNLLTKR